MVTLYSRAGWGARKPRCATPMPTTGVDRLVRHWPGTTADHLSSDPEDVARYLQGWQDWHMDGRGWCDIAYQYAVDLAGGIWTLRGYAHQSGAHTPWNEEGYAVLCVAGDQDRPTRAMLDGLAWLRRAALTRTPAATGWYGHGQLPGTATACPGPYIRAVTLADLTGENMGVIDNTAANRAVIAAAVHEALEAKRPYRSSSVHNWATERNWGDVDLRYVSEIALLASVRALETATAILAELARLAPLVADAADLDEAERAALSKDIAAQVDRLRVVLEHDEPPPPG